MTTLEKKTVEKKTIRSDIPGSHLFLHGNVGYVGSTSEETRRLIVGRDISLNGEIATCDHLLIEGIVRADGFSARRLDILEPGVFVGSARVQESVIAGRFEGDLYVAGRLTLKSTAQVFGHVQYGIIEIEAGAKIEGRLQPVLAAPVAVDVPPAPEQKLPDNVEPLFMEEPEDGAPLPAEKPGRSSVYRRNKSRG